MLSVTDVRQFYLGVQGENEEQTITVDVKPWLASYPNGVVSIWHKRNGESVPTPTGAVYDAEAGTITWIPTYTDTYNAGEGEAEIRLYENGVIKKTRIVKTGVAPSVTGAAGVTLESGWQGMINYIDDVVEDAKEAADDAGDAAEAAEDAQGAAEAAQSAAEDAQLAAENAQGAAETAQGKAEDAQTAAEAAQAAAESAMMHYPYVDPTTGNWMLWNPETGAYVNTGIHAQGPTGTVPDIQVGTVTTLLPDQPATVTRRSGSPDEEPIFDFGIPKGDTGQAENIYGNTIDMSALDSTKVSAAIGAKTDKVSGATSGNFAGLDANGNLTDSGSKASDFLTSHQDISGKADKVSSATSGNFAGLDSNGNLTDSGHKHSDYLTSHQDISGKQDKTDNSLDTTAKTVVGAINEHESDITSLNSKIIREALSSGDFDSLTVSMGGIDKHYYGSDITAITHAPSGENGSFSLDVKDMGSYSVQVLTVYSATTVKVYQRQQYWGGSKVWGNWDSFALNSKIGIKSQSVSGAISQGSTLQLSSEMMNCNVLFISVGRYGYGGSFVVTTGAIKGGMYAAGIGAYISSTRAITLSISTSGLITVVSANDPLNFIIQGVL